MVWFAIHTQVISISGVPGKRGGRRPSEQNSASLNCVFNFFFRKASFQSWALIFARARSQTCTYVTSGLFVFMHPEGGKSQSYQDCYKTNDAVLTGFFSPTHFVTGRCTSSLRATNRRCVASGRRRGASRPSRRTTRPPAASAARPSLPTAAATSAPTARPNSAPAAEAGSPCAPTMWENLNPLLVYPSPHCFRWCSVGPAASVSSPSLFLSVLATLWWGQSVLDGLFCAGHLKQHHGVFLCE